MNAGLSSLINLKTRLLPAQSLSQTDWDNEILALGLGVAGWFERLCDRRFQRLVNDVYLCRSDRTYVVVPRYPVETVGQLQQILTGQTLWSPATQTYLLYPESGLIDFAEAIGSPYTQLSVTYTGGYWWDETEDGTGVQPTGSYCLPNDLLYAWQEQCAFLFERRSKLGLEKISHVGGTFSISPTSLLPHVAMIVQNYRRNALT